MAGTKIEERTQVDISGGTGIGIPGGRGPGTRELGEEEGFVEEFHASPVSPQPPRRHSTNPSFQPSLARSSTTLMSRKVENDHHFVTHGHHIPHSPFHLPPILPMYPNGVPGTRRGGSSAGSGTSTATSIRNVMSSTIPIRGIGMGTGVSGSKLLAGTVGRERSAEHHNPRNRKKAGKTKRRA